MFCCHILAHFGWIHCWLIPTNLLVILQCLCKVLHKADVSTFPFDASNVVSCKVAHAFVPYLRGPNQILLLQMYLCHPQLPSNSISYRGDIWYPHQLLLYQGKVCTPWPVCGYAQGSLLPYHIIPAAIFFPPSIPDPFKEYICITPIKAHL